MLTRCAYLDYLFQGIYYNFELFRIREKQIPVDKVECKGGFNICQVQSKTIVITSFFTLLALSH